LVRIPRWAQETRAIPIQGQPGPHIGKAVEPATSGLSRVLSGIAEWFSTRGGRTVESGIQANKRAGDLVRDEIATREAPAKTEQTFKTVGGVRRLDVLKLGDKTIAIESKVGLTGLRARERQELARDWWLRRQGQVGDVRWEFSRSKVTGEVGPKPQLQEKLDKLNFDVKINP